MLSPNELIVAKYHEKVNKQLPVCVTGAAFVVALSAEFKLVVGILLIMAISYSTFNGREAKKYGPIGASRSRLGIWFYRETAKKTWPFLLGMSLIWLAATGVIFI